MTHIKPVPDSEEKANAAGSEVDKTTDNDQDSFIPVDEHVECWVDEQHCHCQMHHAAPQVDFPF